MSDQVITKEFRDLTIEEAIAKYQELLTDQINKKILIVSMYPTTRLNLQTGESTINIHVEYCDLTSEV